MSDDLIIKYKKYYEFIYRADTVHKCIIAEEWIEAHRSFFVNNVYEDLLLTLNQIKEILVKREQIAQDIDNLKATRSYYMGIKYELDLMGREKSKDYANTVNAINELTEQIKTLQQMLET